RVTQILGDAKEVEINDTFDLVFIDASKGNNLLFFEKFSQLLSEDGIVVVDNILLRGQIIDDNLESKNRIKLRDKVQKFNEYRYENYPSASFLNIGDGLLITNKQRREEIMDINNKEYPMTQEGFDKLEEELDYLKTIKRPEVVEKIKV